MNKLLNRNLGLAPGGMTIYRALISRDYLLVWRGGDWVSLLARFPTYFCLTSIFDRQPRIS
jgi:hypothetical protein